MTATSPVLRAANLSRSFRVRGTGQEVRALRGVDLTVPAGSAVGLVGESGSGKSTFARIVAGLLQPSSGELELMGTGVAGLPERRRRRLAVPIQMIFQNPRASLNPRLPVHRCVAEPLLAQGRRPGRQEVLGLLDRVGLPARVADLHAHELSGGQCQRVAIARAVAARPALIVADEPVSALDVSVQAQVLNLLKDIQEESGTSFLFISHDLGVVRFFCDEVNVLYLGQIVERGDAESVFADPRHPYTEALASAVPDVSDVSGADRPRRIVLNGEPPRPEQPPPGCAFHTRCHRRIGPICDETAPELLPIATGLARCHLRA
ncbi:oligopeptide/dipeptide ABC transporter ATP-binding protein [Nonomuraea mesophila]|uniref:oligopeptide/dipeptide ABC transporter ATP-binding protein n=1 Tax=Nonomuraea mesophila TaxID=2530382 RepID=UPI001C7045C7|nr:ABC transporter ATP-binding protein [Nonomuraea mesophila]